MKDFLPRTHFNEEHEMFRDMVRGFVEKEITPNVERWHNEGMPDREIFKKAGELGLIGMSTPEEEIAGLIRVLTDRGIPGITEYRDRGRDRAVNS